MAHGFFEDTSERLLTPALDQLVDEPTLGRILPGTFGKVTWETSPAVELDTYFALRMPRPEESYDPSPWGLAFLFTARPLDATKRLEDFRNSLNNPRQMVTVDALALDQRVLDG